LQLHLAPKLNFLQQAIWKKYFLNRNFLETIFFLQFSAVIFKTCRCYEVSLLKFSAINFPYPLFNQETLNFAIYNIAVN